MNPLKLFKIRPEERVQAIVALVVILLFNALLDTYAALIQ